MIDLKVAEDARDSVEAVLVPRLVRLTAENVSLVARQETLESNLNIAHRSARTWRRRYDEVRNDSSATVRDILETADSAVAATTEEAQECSLALKNCGLVTANLEEQNEALADRLAASQKLNAEQGRTLEILRAARQGKPILPWAIAATSIVLVIAALVL